MKKLKGMPFLDDEKLIDAVKCRPFMYDGDDPQHNSRQVLFKSWREIAQELGQEVHFVKDRWVSMRDYYRRKLRELERIKSGQLDKKFKKWSLFDKLDFLRPYLRHIELDGSSALEVDNGPVENSRNDTDIDTDDESVHLGFELVKAENTDEEEEENQSDDSLRKDIAQALDSGLVSLDMRRNKGEKAQNQSNNTKNIRRRPAYLETNESSIQPTISKMQRIEWTPPGSSIKRVRICNAATGGSSTQTSTNHQFFTSLIPMIETLDSLTAMEFRHEVHGLLLNYLKQEREKKKAETAKQTNDKLTATSARAGEVANEELNHYQETRSNNIVENGTCNS